MLRNLGARKLCITETHPRRAVKLNLSIVIIGVWPPGKHPAKGNAESAKREEVKARREKSKICHAEALPQEGDGPILLAAYKAT